MEQFFCGRYIDEQGLLRKKSKKSHQTGRLVCHWPKDSLGQPVRDIQSGLKNWTRFRGYDADVFTQLTDFNHTVPDGSGFSFEDMKAEIDAGYPILLYMQNFEKTSRNLSNPVSMPDANPNIHGMIATGYWIRDNGERRVIFHTSWASGQQNAVWNDMVWEANLPVRGVIGYHPKPRVKKY